MSDTATERELVITRVFDAPRELVFECWTDPNHLARWWGPSGFTAPSVTVNGTEGGAWRTCIRNEEGVEYWSSGVYLEIRPPERLVFSFTWDPVADQPVEDTLVTVTFADRDGKTEMAFHQSGFDTVESRDGHESGWRECFADLAAYVAGGAR
ncbi:MAG: SRPBCC domain-containing protein [Actinophytocola sp.]|nr:SRPBCC domain-containing protein [Actinophytocola sp.]MPZ83130.1 SRPBCC domain-containing protein [Actinophytocola sp.]